MMILAQVILTLNDSHTNFYPPSRSADVDYGWRVSMVGKNCYVTGVKPKSDAEAKGMKIGDRVLLINGYKPTRENLWQMYYRYYSIIPIGAVRFTVQNPDEAKPRVVDVQTKITKTSNAVKIEDIINRIIKKGWDTEADRYVEAGKNLFIWKMTTFSTSDQHIDDMLRKANGAKSFILDLRGNGGGAVSILKRLVGYFTDQDLKIADEKRKRETKPMIAKPRGNNLFKGNLIVLIDHDSGSASEIFARTVQLNKFGKLIGDKTAGAVMESEFYPMEIGTGNIIFYGASITVADVIMPDGASLEKVGVTPDEIVLPTGKDLAEGKDPVLSYAAKQLGVDISPEKAGTLFPIIWDK
jgi:C-terminal processing protease CtpA/Prc